jgi:hypothetical protein
MKKRKTIAIVTGATSGFGKIFAKLADIQFEKIDEFWLIGRNSEKLAELSGILKHRVKSLPYDLSEMENLKKIGQLLTEEQPAVKFLVNAAGFGITGHVEEQEAEELAEMVDVNCRALTYLTRICIPYMAKNSRIINFASVAAFMPQPSFAVYAATKAYVLSFTRALNCELKKRDVHVLAVCPGPAKTEFFSRAEKHGQKAGAYKDLFMVEPEYVVEKAIQDSICKKEISVYSLPMKGLHLLTRIVPRRFIFRWLV